jgi:outer membrane protein assembly factor BamB
MKKLNYLFAAIMLIAVSACSDKNDSKDENNNPTNQNADAKWIYETGESSLIFGSTPAIDNENNIYAIAEDLTAYPVTQTKVFCISNEGEKQWETTISKQITTDIVLREDHSILAGTSDNSLICFNNTGSILWEYSTDQKKISESPAIDETGNIYMAVSSHEDLANNKIQPLTLLSISSNGTFNWERQFSGFHLANSSPVIHNGMVYFVAEKSIYEDDPGRLYAVSTEGDSIWSQDIPGSSRNDIGLDANGNLYVTAGNGSLYAFSNSGASLWTFPTGNKIWASPVVDSDGNIYFGSYDNFIYCVNPSGQELWKTDDFQGNPEFAGLIANNNQIYFSIITLFALDKNSGDTTWENNAIFPASAPAMDHNGNLIVGGMGKIYCFETNASGIEENAPTAKEKYSYTNNANQ